MRQSKTDGSSVIEQVQAEPVQAFCLNEFINCACDVVKAIFILVDSWHRAVAKARVVRGDQVELIGKRRN